MEIHTSDDADITVLRVSGKLSAADYESWRTYGQHGPHLLVEIRDLDGWDVDSGWQALSSRQDERFSRFEKVAFVGDERAEPYLPSFSQLFAHNEIRIFPLKEMDNALEWLKGGASLEALSTRSLPQEGA